MQKNRSIFYYKTTAKMHQNAGNEAIFVNFSGALERAPYHPAERTLTAHLKFRAMSSPKDLTKKMLALTLNVFAIAIRINPEYCSS
jgi:hypothetical protein